MIRGTHLRRRVIWPVTVALALTLVAPVRFGSTEARAVPATVARSFGGLEVAAAASAGHGALSVPERSPITFSLIGFEHPLGAEVEFRTKPQGGRWTPWEHAHGMRELAEGPDPDSDEANLSATHDVTNPVWVRSADWVQVRVEGAPVRAVRVHVVDSLGQATDETVDVPTASRFGTTATAATTPPMVTRAEWGADESIVKGDADYADELDFAVVHHTAGTNDYTRDEAPAIVRGIQRYHVQSLGWSDIGYNFLVDRFGVLYEGRRGGVDRPVIGAHARGYNTGSVGVSVLGNFENVKAPWSARETVAQVVAWKFSIHDVDPHQSSVTTVTGAKVKPINGHRDLGSTACPGDLLYAKLDSIRKRVKELWSPNSFVAVPNVAPSVQVVGAGSGESVGLSQYGALALARAGKGTGGILKHYFPGTTVQKVARSPKVRIGLSTDPPVDRNSSTWWKRQDRVKVYASKRSPEAIPWVLCEAGQGCKRIGLQKPGTTWNLIRRAASKGGWRVVRPGKDFSGGDDGSWVEVRTWKVKGFVMGPHPHRGRALYHYGKLAVSTADTSGMHVVSKLSLEAYLRGLAEVPPDWADLGGTNALRAQAIAARTVVLRMHRANRGADPSCSCTVGAAPPAPYWVGYDDSLDSATSPWRSAVDKTRRRTVRYGSRLALTPFSASHGGRSENVGDSYAFDESTADHPYLTSVSDPYSLDPSVGNPRARWVRSVPNADVARLMGLTRVTSLAQDDLDRTAGGTPRSLHVRGVDSSGARVTTTWTGPTKSIAGAHLKVALGLDSQQLVRVGLAPFADDDGNRHETAIAQLTAAGIVTTCSGGTAYCPGNALRRDHLATMVVRSITWLTREGGTPRFSDTPAQHYHTPSINAAADAGIVTGCGGTKYCPKDGVTKATIAGVLARMRELPLADPVQRYSDVPVDHPENAAINAAVDAGIIRPCSATRFCAARIVKRDWAAALFLRTLTS